MTIVPKIWDYRAQSRSRTLGLLTFALIVILTLTGPFDTVRAAVTVSVSPSFLEFAADPGTDFSEIITVTNEGEDSTGMRVEVTDTLDDRPDISASSWLEVSPSEFDLPPGESQEVTLTTAVPADSPPGGRYATIFFRTVPILDVKSGKTGGFEGGSGGVANIGAKFIVTVRGPGLELAGEMTELVPVALGPGRIGFRTEFRNTGTVHTAISGELVLKDSDGAEVGRYELPETTSILPDTSRTFSFRGFQDVPAGEYSAEGVIRFGWTQRQSEAAQVDPTDWTVRESTETISFNSVPVLTVSGIDMDVAQSGDVTFTLTLTNDGDVEVAPAGAINVHDSKGERFIALNIGAGKLVVEPHSSATSKHVDTVRLPKGNYEISALFNYFGAENAEGVSTKEIRSEVIPGRRTGGTGDTPATIPARR